jgi:hypothetical protein
MPEAMRNAYNILVSDLKESYRFGGIGIFRNIVLKRSAEKQDMKKWA